MDRSAEKSLHSVFLIKFLCDFKNVLLCLFILIKNLNVKNNPMTDFKKSVMGNVLKNLTKTKQPPYWMTALGCWHRPIFPGRRQPSIVGTGELNYRVRDGNGWTLTAINTNC